MPSILPLLLLLCAPQEAPPPVSEAPARPASEPAAVAVLVAARAHLYDPRDDGLREIRFRLPVRMSVPGEEPLLLGDVEVRWETRRAPEFETHVAEDLPEELAAQRGMISFQIEAQGRQALRYLHNDLFGEILLGYRARLLGTDPAHVRFEPAEDGEEIPPIDWWFDGAGVPDRFTMTSEQDGLVTEIAFRHLWRPVSRVDPALVLAELAVEQTTEDTTSVVTTRLDRVEIQGVSVLVGYEERVETPDGRVLLNEVRFEDLQVTVDRARGTPAATR